MGPLQRVAVLPLSNETNDLDGPIYVRKLIQDGLTARGVQLVPLDGIDQKLRDNGFTEGGQLGAAQPVDLGQWLEADTLFYTNLVEFGYINIGFYWQRKVKVVSRMVDAKTGERLWEAEKGWTTRWVVTDKEKAKKQFLEQLAIQAAEKLMKVPLAHESKITVNQLLDSIPHR